MYKKYVGPIDGGQAPTTEKALQPTSVEPSATDQPDSAGNCPSSSPVKVSKNGISHVKGDPNYDRTTAKSCFSTPEAAQAAGFRAPKR